MSIIKLLILLIIFLVLFNINNIESFGNSNDFGYSLSEQNNKIYVVSFAHNCCNLAIENLEKTALSEGAFKFFNINLETLEASEDTKEIIRNNKKGAGFWCWKPFVIEQILKIIPEDSILIYVDSSTYFMNTNNFNNIKNFINANNILCFKHGDIERDLYPDNYLSTWTKMNAVKKVLNQESNWCETQGFYDQFIGGFIGIKNNALARNFIFDLKELMSAENLNLYDDSPSDIPNCKNFKESRHDQQMLTLLLYKNWNNINFPNYDRDYYGWIWHERINGKDRHK